MKFVKVTVQTSDDGSSKVTVQTSDDGSSWNEGSDTVVELPATPGRIAEVSAEVIERLEKLSANEVVNG